MDLRCEQVLKRLGPLTEAGELISPDLTTGVREHLDQCVECQAFLRRDASLRRRLQALRAVSGDRSFPETARVALRARIGDVDLSAPDIQPARTGPSRRWPAWTEAAVAAAAAIALIVGGLSISRSIGAPVSDGAFAQDFMHAALPEITSGNLSAIQVSEFYQQQFGDQMSPARLLDAPVTRVAVCDVGGRRGAMVEYDFQGERLAYYQLPLDGGRSSSDLRSGREGSLNVARWGDERSEHVLVSALSAEQLENLARRRMD